MHSIPIGILTRDRPGYLDLTLRSLSAVRGIEEHPVVVFDDCSDGQDARQYLAGQQVKRGEIAPTAALLRCLGVDDPGAGEYIGPIENRVMVVLLAARSLGVVEASKSAIHCMMAWNPKARGAILVQDDVAFKSDFLERMEAAIDYDMRSGRPQGILAAVTLEREYPPGLELPLVENVRFASAQAYYVSRRAWQACGWFRTLGVARRYFDTLACKNMIRAGYEIHLLHPFAAQHVGDDSTIVPGFKLLENKRIGFDVGPPYAMAGSVRHFTKR